MSVLKTLQSLSRNTHEIKKSRSSRYPTASYRRLSVGFEPLEDRRLLSITITPSWLAQQGSAPYILSANNTTYVLDTDVTVNGTAFVFGGKNITFDLGGHTITYGNSAPLTVTNGGFETGAIGDNYLTSVAGWDLSNAHSAAIAANTYYLWGNQVLKFINITSKQTIISDSISIPVANIEYTATVNSTGAWAIHDDSTLTLSVVLASDHTTVLGTNTINPGSIGQPAAKVTFVPTSTAAVCLEISVAPASGKIDTIPIDYVSLDYSRNYGIICGRSYWNLPADLQTLSSTIMAVGLNDTNAVIKNGSILQGQGNGYNSLPIWLDGSGPTTIDNVITSSSGINTGAISAYESNTIAITNSTFQSTVDKCIVRTSPVALILANTITTGGCVITGNNFIDSPQYGIYANNVSGLTVRDNTFSSNTIVTDGYAIALNKVTTFEISGNTITVDRGKSGRGILLDCCNSGDTSSYGEIFDNYVDVREKPSPEYGTSLNVVALRQRVLNSTALGLHDVNIYDNTFIARTGIGGVKTASGVRFTFPDNGSETDLNNIFKDNICKAIVETTDTSYFASALKLETIAANKSPLIIGNTFESNDTSLQIGGPDGMDEYDGNFLSNTFCKSSDGAARTYSSMGIGYYTGVVHNIRLIDNVYTGGATSAIMWIGSGLKDVSIGWLLGLKVNDQYGVPLNQAIVLVTDKNGTVLVSGMTDANGLVSSSPVITTIYSQTGTNPSNISTESLNPLRIIVSQNGYITYDQPLTITQSQVLQVNLQSSPVLIVQSGDWTDIGLTVKLGGDGELHVYRTGTTIDAIPPQVSANVSSIQITGRNNADDALTVDFSAGNPIPADGLVFDGGSHVAGDTFILKDTANNDNVILTGTQVILTGVPAMNYSNVEFFGFDLGAGDNTLLVDHAMLKINQDNAISAGTDVTISGGVLDLNGKANTLGDLVLQSGSISSGTLHANLYNIESGTVIPTITGLGIIQKTTTGQATTGIENISNVSVDAGQLTATSIYTNTLTIGAGAIVIIAPIPGGPLAANSDLTPLSTRTLGPISHKTIAEPTAINPVATVLLTAISAVTTEPLAASTVLAVPTPASFEVASALTFSGSLSNTVLDAVAVPSGIVTDTALPVRLVESTQARRIDIAINRLLLQANIYYRLDTSVLPQFIESGLEQSLTTKNGNTTSTQIPSSLRGELSSRVEKIDKHRPTPAINNRQAHITALQTVVQNSHWTEAEADFDIAQYVHTRKHSNQFEKAIDEVLAEEEGAILVEL